MEVSLPPNQLEPSPVCVLGVLPEAPHTQSGLLEGMGSARAIHKVLVEELHEHACTLVWDPLQSGEDRLGTSKEEGPSHPDDAICTHYSTTAVTAAQNDQGRFDVHLLHLTW